MTRQSLNEHDRANAEFMRVLQEELDQATRQDTAKPLPAPLSGPVAEPVLPSLDPQDEDHTAPES